MALLELKNVSKYYRSDEMVSMGMRDISIEFNIGEFVAITGASGSGKSTLLNVIAGLDSYDEGEFYINGEETSHFTISDWENYRGQNIGFIFQNYNIIESYTVYQNIMLALEVSDYPRHERKEKALSLIDKVGLSKHKHKKTAKLSGGEKQRCVIARALAKNSKIIVADEPTGNLDSESGKNILNLLHELSKERLILLVTHNYAEAEGYATRRIQMHDGEIQSDKKLKPIDDLHNEKITLDIKNKMSFRNTVKFSLRNLFATPKKFLLFILLQMLVMFALVSYYGNILQTVHLNTDSLIQSDLSEKRLKVKNKDGKLFTPNQADGLLAVYEHSQYFFDDSYLSLGTTPSMPMSYVAQVRAFEELEDALKTKIVSKYDVILSESIRELLGTDQIYLQVEQRYSFDNNFTASLNIVGTTKEENTIYFSHEFLSSVKTSEDDYQSLIFKDRKAAESFVKKIDTANNLVFYKYSVEPLQVKLLTLIIVTFMGAGFVGVAIFLYFIIQIVLKNVMISRKKDFGIYRSIGINKKTLGQAVIIEQVFLSLISFILTMSYLYISETIRKTTNGLFNYINIYHMIFLLFIFFILAARLAILFNKKLFNISVIETLTEGRAAIWLN